MKFNIKEEQAGELEAITKRARAHEQVFNTVYANYLGCVEGINAEIDDVWGEIIDEHELDMVNHNWAVSRDENNQPFVYNVVEEVKDDK